MSSTLQHIGARLYEGDDEEVSRAVQQALVEGTPPGEILSRGLIAGMDQVGHDFRNGDLFVPEVLASARAMHAGMEILRPLLSDTAATSAGTYVIGTVEGDLHDIGKSLVKLLLQGAGFTGVDLGTDVSPQGFVAAVREHHPDLLAMSALLTTTMVQMQSTIDALTEAGLRDAVKVMVGGAPVTSGFARQIGADAYAPDAGRAVDAARSLVAS